MIEQPKVPQTVSSESESDDSTTSTIDNRTTVSRNASSPKRSTSERKNEERQELATKATSRLFAPFRSIGIVSNGPFHLLPNQDSSNAMLCVAIGDRFQILQCDKLNPVLVSKAAPGNKAKEQQISHLVSDASLSIALVAHGPRNRSDQVTLFQRTRPIVSVRITQQKGFTIRQIIHLGRIKTRMGGEKKGTMENSAFCAVLLSRSEANQDSVPRSGDDSSSDSEGDVDGSDDGSLEGNSDYAHCRGEVVLVIATRTSLRVRNRISLTEVPTFVPWVAEHPSTYMNKLLVGGYCYEPNANSILSNSTKRDAMILLNVKTGKIIHSFSCLPLTQGSSSITSLEQSPAVDTVAVGTSLGEVHLVNIKLDALLFSLSHKPRDTRTKQQVQITSIAFRTDSSALQYGIAPMAVGRSDGSISIWDLTPQSIDSDDEHDEVHESSMGRTLLCEMREVHSPGGVCQLQYMPQEPLLLSSGTNSNAILMHIFDNPDHSGRVLRERRGHTSPPTNIRYLNGMQAGQGVMVNAADGTDATSCQILSSGGSDRSLRLFSTVRTALDKEYSQGGGLQKRAKLLGLTGKSDLLLPRLTAMAKAETRSRDWGDIVTIHQNHAFAYIWSSQRGAQSGPVLRQDDWNVSAMKVPPPPEAHATSVAMSACGNFALVGTRGGIIFKYNVQSGNARGSYPIHDKSNDDKSRKRMAGNIERTAKVLEKSMKIASRAINVDKEERNAIEQAMVEQRRRLEHERSSHLGSAVVGIAVDAVNKAVISVGSDAKLMVWNFSTHYPHKNSPFLLPAKATKLCHVRDSDLAAVALVDFTTILFDCSSLKIVRRFGVGDPLVCHTAPITDLGFSPDARLLFTSSWDGTIRVWDVPTNSCIDWLGFNSPPTSLCLSPTGEYLATTHSGKLGISLWSDMSYYQTVHIDSSQQLSCPALLGDPVPISEVEFGGEALFEGITLDRAEKHEYRAAEVDENTTIDAPVTKEKGLVMLSGLHASHWKNLFHLELVKQRNKPAEAPKKPPSAPFFLQWRPSESLTGEATQNTDISNKQRVDEEWNSNWSDDEEADATMEQEKVARDEKRTKRDQKLDDDTQKKKPRVKHYRSHVAKLLDECAHNPMAEDNQRFLLVTEHISTLGPSAIDIALSSLCNGPHDLEEGLPLLRHASSWLLEACETRERYEAVNAYMLRFLYLHSNTIAGIENFVAEASHDNEEESEVHTRLRGELLKNISALRRAQRKSSVALHDKIQNALCLLRHFSRMV